MNTYTVHIYREMRLRFDGVKAETPEAAAYMVRDWQTQDADDFAECDGQTFAALVDIEGDDNFGQSRTIDFEAGRLSNAAPPNCWSPAGWSLNAGRNTTIGSSLFRRLPAMQMTGSRRSGLVPRTASPD